MFWGVVLTVSALAFMVIWALIQILRIDRIIERVDQAFKQKNSAKKK